jgi:hypothetical protein
MHKTARRTDGERDRKRATKLKKYRKINVRETQGRKAVIRKERREG